MHLNLVTKYTIFILSLVASVALILFGIASRQFTTVSSSYIQSSSQVLSQALMQGMERRGIAISQLLAENLVNPVYNYDQNAIYRLLLVYKSYSNVVGVYVYDTGGKLIHDGTGTVEHYGSLVDDRAQVQKALFNQTPSICTQGSTIEIYHPISLDKTILGGVKVVLSLSEIQAQTGKMQTKLTDLSQSAKNEAFRHILIALFAILAVSTILSYSLARRISSPIGAMARYAARVGQGDYGNRIEYRAKDEIGELANAFNKMQLDLMHSTVSIHELETQVDLRTLELAKANADLTAHKEKLEAKVSERTAELVETNKTLTREIEERKNIQEKLVRAKKMEAIGTLAAAVAHDLNNILTGMVGIPDLILMNLSSDNPLAEEILKIKKSGLRAAAVVQDLLNLARKSVVANHPLDMGSAVQEYLNSPEHKEILKNCPGVSVQTDIQPLKYMVLGSQVHLTKALMNLISNAAESMPAGGHIKISLRSQFIDPSDGRHKDMPKGEYIALQVQDSGDGIPAENLGRIFEPFYTTKQMGRSGSGLGMTVVWETVRDHNGHMDVQSTVGKGTTFTLYLPKTEAEASQKPEGVSSENYRGRGEAVLIIDDLESQRNLLKNMVTRLGYIAQTFPSGEDAVAYLKDHSADILILDMMMAPGMDGLDTYQEIIKFRPGQKAIVVSGYSDSLRTQQLQELGVGAYIRKPYTMKQIGRAVRTELDR